MIDVLFHSVLQLPPRHTERTQGIEEGQFSSRRYIVFSSYAAKYKPQFPWNDTQGKLLEKWKWCKTWSHISLALAEQYFHQGRHYTRVHEGRGERCVTARALLD